MRASAGLGLSETTCHAWGAGYAPKGIMRGRLAVPIRDRAGTLLAYVGIAVSEQASPRLHFPNGFDPHSIIFGAGRFRRSRGRGREVLGEPRRSACRRARARRLGHPQ